MENIGQQAKVVAIILAAGVGSRIRPLTDNCPKSLLKVGEETILNRMLENIQANGIHEVVFVLGYLEEQIKSHVKNEFPNLNTHFIRNDLYAETNTGYSLMLALDLIKDSAFVKFDADVVFENEILENLLDCQYADCLCVDKNINLDAEEIKVIIGDDNRVVKASKTVNPKDAAGESIGIEKISSKTAKLLLKELQIMMDDKKNYQEYYEGAYERLIDKNIPFYALDISGSKWTEIDTKEDLIKAENIFTGEMKTQM
ncbi:MAG: phosphocholine cytidylyltransferase family protein [Nitrospina sp.]|jgi:choline kinase|nr:phosphocholine cytidylyltransferase family protein [Nitrospina sp.]